MNNCIPGILSFLITFSMKKYTILFYSTAFVDNAIAQVIKYKSAWVLRRNLDKFFSQEAARPNANLFFFFFVKRVYMLLSLNQIKP